MNPSLEGAERGVIRSSCKRWRGWRWDQKLPLSPKSTRVWVETPPLHRLALLSWEASLFSSVTTCVRRSPWGRRRGRRESSATGCGSFLREAASPDTSRTQSAYDAESALPSLVAGIVAPTSSSPVGSGAADASPVCSGSLRSSPARLPAPEVVLPPRSARASPGAPKVYQAPHTLRRLPSAPGRVTRADPPRPRSPLPHPHRRSPFSRGPAAALASLLPGARHGSGGSPARPAVWLIPALSLTVSPEKWNLPWNSRWLEPADWACSEAKAGFGLK